MRARASRHPLGRLLRQSNKKLSYDGSQILPRSCPDLAQIEYPTRRLQNLEAV